jgi:nitroreductase
MDVKEAIAKRRAYRSLEKVEITEELVTDLAKHAQLSASCFNNQPTRFVFAYDPEVLKKLHDTLSSGNAWAKEASMIIAVFAKKDMDCDIKDREYYLFDLGQASAFLQLRATELGLVAHPIAGFDELKVKEILNIPAEMKVITIIIVGKKSDTMNPVLSEKQQAREITRPERLSIDRIAFRNYYFTPED